MASRELLVRIVLIAGFPSIATGQFVPGDLYISGPSSEGSGIRQVDAVSWSLSEFADENSGLSEPAGLVFSPSGTLVCANFDTDEIIEFDANGIPSIVLDAGDEISQPTGVVYDDVGNLVVANNNFFKPKVLLFPAGGGAPLLLADYKDGLVSANALALASDGDGFVGDYWGSAIWMIDSAAVVSRFDTLPDGPTSIAVRENGDVYVVTWPNVSVYRYPAGDASQRELFSDFPELSGVGCVALSLDQQTLYLASSQEIYAIDADSGHSTEVLSDIILNSTSVTVFGKYLRATWSNYGAGFPGTNGVPAFTPQSDPLLGTTVTVDVANSYGQSTIGLMFVGFQQTCIHSGWGGDLLVIPVVTVPIAPFSGVESFSGNLPGDPRLAGTNLELQVIELDPGAAKGVSFTQGLELVLGY